MTCFWYSALSAKLEARAPKNGIGSSAHSESADVLSGDICVDPLQQRSTRTGIFALSPLHGRLSWQGSSLMQPVIDRGSSRHSRNVRSMSILALLAVCNYDIAISFEGTC